MESPTPSTTKDKKQKPENSPKIKRLIAALEKEIQRFNAVCSAANISSNRYLEEATQD